MTEQADESVAAALRAAHQQLDERASLGVRAAILRTAAARAAGDVLDWDEQRPPQARAPRRGSPWWRIWVPPLSLTATLLVCVLAIGVFLHQANDQAPAESTSQSVVPPATEAKKAAPIIMVQPLAPAPAAAAKAARQAQVTIAPPSPAAPPIPALAPAPATSLQEAAPSARALAAPRSAAPLAPSAARPAPNADAYTADPQRWLQRIAKLREAGENDRADDELRRFKLAYPDVEVPANALPR